MKKNLFFLISAMIVLSGCSAKAVLVKNSVDYDPKTDARIRIYNSAAQKGTKIFKGKTCQDYSDNKVYANRFYNGLPRKTLKNTTIGIPLTATSVERLNRSSYNDVIYFSEEILTANAPVVINGNHFTTGYGPGYYESCQIVGEFTPEAGKDYELRYGETNNHCRLYIYELIPETSNEDSRIQAKYGKDMPYKKCN